MLKLSGNRIKMTQGDSVQIEISLTDGNGRPYEPHGGDTLAFGMRKTPYSKDCALYKEIRNALLELTPAETKSLGAGRYVYDVQLTTAGGYVFTVISCAEFEIVPEVIRDGC